MAAGTLYTYPENFRAFKALIASQYSKADVKIAPNFIFGETNKTTEFQKKFPNGKVPAFESAQGETLQDSNAIAYFVANDQLKGNNEYEKAQILQWVGFAEGEILPSACAWVFPIIGILTIKPNGQENFQKAKDDLKTVLTILNNHLLTRTYLVGERITLADIIVGCNLLNAYIHVLDPEYRKSFINVNRWFTTIINQPEFKNVIGNVVLCSKPAVLSGQQPSPSGDGAAHFNNNAAANNVKDSSKSKEKRREKSNDSSEKDKTELLVIEKSGGKKKGKKKKEEKKEKSKKEAPKKEAEPVEVLDAADEILAAEPQSKDPFSLLPKGTFIMDEFKRVYSNEDESKSIPWFFEKFDSENYSIWYGEYKYPEELSKVFMSCNLITGMFQRLDKMRKQAFASVCLFGKDNDSTISGIWIWRGQELAFNLTPDWQIDYEVYDWKKLDANAEETKKLVQQYLSWTGTDKAGREFNQGKIFK